MRGGFLVTAFTVLLLAAAVSARAGDTPLINGVVNFHGGAKGAVIINDIPIKQFNRGGGYTTGGVGLDIVGWLRDGRNEVQLRIEWVLDKGGGATLEFHNAASGEQLLLIDVKEYGEKTAGFEIDGLPRWKWMRATPVSEAAAGLRQAVGDLHDAYSNADLEQIVSILAPYFADQEHFGGMDATEFSERAAPLLAKGELAPMQELTIERYADGKLFHVTRPDGDPPIRLVLTKDGHNTALRMGEWWSLIDGTWKVVR